VGHPRLAEAAGPEDGDDPVLGEEAEQCAQVAVPADEVVGVVPDPVAQGPVRGQEVGVGTAQVLARVGAEPVCEVDAVAVVSLQAAAVPRTAASARRSAASTSSSAGSAT